ncbi:AraC family transcriptional regulator [Paraliobacillus zengyii]|uniref:AraC family transcriptional regulator n=1 Tax=Paraliobacillus zengyii TaxID=2213194 RepID=UPI000DD31353|nr:AraC family transcriptional regulator [Paraliobacillus zengyii]
MDNFKNEIKHLWFTIEGHYTLKLNTRQIHELMTNTNTLIYVQTGEAEVYDDLKSKMVLNGDLLYCNPAKTTRIVNIGDSPLKVKVFTFTCSKISRVKGDWQAVAYIIPFNSFLTHKSATNARSVMESLWEIVDDTRNNQQIEIQVLIRNLLENLIEADGINDKSVFDEDAGILQIAKLMKANTQEEFMIEELAEKSGSSVSVFYQRFKKRMGLSPGQYIIEHRIRKSRELLSGSSFKVSEVAHSVGYSDEYYFSRIFKKKVGLSPIQFMHCSRKKIAALSWEIEETLLALGIKPCVAIMNTPRPWRWEKVIDSLADQLREAKPDLIIAPSGEEACMEILSEIAPVYFIDWRGENWDSNLIKTAEILGMKEAAFAWLSNYYTREEQVRKHLYQETKGESFLLVKDNQNSLGIYGSKKGRRIGEFVYQSLGLKQPESLKGISYLEVKRWSDLEDFDADRIIYLIDEFSEQYRHKLMATKSDNVYISNSYPWTHNSALGHELMLDKALSLFS